MEGWIKIHRKLLDNPIVCKDSETLAIWLYLLLNATHQEYDVLFKGKRITLKEGELLTGILSIAKKLKIDKNKVQRTLKMFEIEKQIEQQTSNRNRLISIVCWNKYQENDKQDDKQVINKRETSDKQVITNKNVKNDKNIKNVKNKVSKKESEKTFNELIDDYTSNEQLRMELKNHLIVRKQKKGALTNRAIELSFKTLDKLTDKIPVNDIEAIDNAKIEIVQQSILKGWVGFFEVKDTTSWKAKDETKSSNIFWEIGREEGIFG